MLLLVVLNELQRVVGEVIDDIAIAANFLTIVIQGRAEVMTPMAGGETVVFVEAAIVGVVGRLCAVVPFAEGAGCVAVGFEDVGNGGLVGIETALAAADAAHAGAGIVAAGEEFRAGRRADLANVEVVKSGAVARQRIDAGRGEVGVAVDAQITPALIVGDEEDDIGAVRTDDGNGQQRGQGKKDCDFSHGKGIRYSPVAVGPAAL